MIEKAQEVLQKYYGYTKFRTGQELAIQSILEGQDIFTIMPTGGGKSLCFQIPALLLPGITIVISPLISLMKDQIDTLQSMDIPASFINSSLDPMEVEDRISRCRKKEYKLIYIAPERLESERFRMLLKSLEISLIAVDEAHCVSQWGHDFRPSYRMIPTMIRELPKRPIVAAFTATATEAVKEDVIHLLDLTDPKIYITGFDRENLYFSVIKGEDKRAFILNYIESHKDDGGIIYTATRKEADNLYTLLNRLGYSVGVYHAGLGDEERAAAQEAFLYDDIHIMIATNAFGMGIDKSNVRYVIHYHLPKNIEAYYQEAGRAGRDGEPSECILLFAAQDILLQKYMIQQNNMPPEREQKEYDKLQDMVDYCHTSRCLRQYILEYFGEAEAIDTCGNCSTCNNETELTDITVEAQKIFSCVLRMKERFGAALIAQVLKGSKNKKVMEFGLDRLSTYGLMNEYGVKEIQNMISILAADEYLYFSGGQYPIVKLQQKALPVLKNQEKVLQRVQKKQRKEETDHTLLDLLKGVRKELSAAERVPPYVIFHDSTLREMSEYYPTEPSDLRKIKGIGEAKLQKYGAAFLEVIRGYVQKHKPQRPSKQEVPERNEKELPSHALTLQLYQQGMTLQEICKERGLKILTVQEHIIRCAGEGMEVNLDDFIPAEHEAAIRKVIQSIGAEKLKPIKEALPEAVDYMAIKAVVCKYGMG